MKTLELGAIINVHGFVMLKGLNANGIYIVSGIDSFSYTFRKINGKKDICRHYKISVEGAINCFNRGDFNGIELV
jgi:hypothetical protein